MASELSPVNTEVPEMEVFGNFTDQLTIVENSLVALIAGIGFIKENGEERAIISPYVELRWRGIQEDDESNGDETIVVAAFLTMDNLAFLIGDMTRDFAEAAGQLAAMARGGLRPDEARIDRTISSLEVAALAADQAISQLRLLATKR